MAAGTKNKFILKVTKESELAKTIEALLLNISNIKHLEKARKKFVFEHYNHMDGNATKRFVKVMEEVLRK